MSELQHGDVSSANSHDPSPHNLGDYLLASLNPIEQFKIAKMAAENPGYLGKNPQDMLMPMVLMDYAVIKPVVVAGKVGGDLLNVGKDGIDLVGDGLGQVRDLGKVGLDVLTLDFPDALKDGKNFCDHTINVFKDEYHMLRDGLQIVPDLLGPLISGPLRAGGDLLGTAWDVAKDGFNVLKDDVHMIGDGLSTVRDVGKTALDIVTLDFPDAFKDAGNAAHDVVDFGKDAVHSLEHGIVDPIKHVVGGVLHAIGDLF
jgi:hypothetical protein